MCGKCKNDGIGRRGLLKLGAASVLAFGFGALAKQAHAANGAPTALSPGDALAALKTGNERYVGNPELCSIDLAQQRNAVAGHQAPWATIISCADSRVPPELIFGGHGVGELFVARNAGNLVDTATPRYGRVWRRRAGLAAHRRPRSYQLRGGEGGLRRRHQECDLSRRDRPDDRTEFCRRLAVQKDTGDFADNTAKESARRTAGRLAAASSLIAGFAGTGKVKIVPAIYDLQTGIVSYLD